MKKSTFDRGDGRFFTWTERGADRRKGLEDIGKLSQQTANGPLRPRKCYWTSDYQFGARWCRRKGERRGKGMRRHCVDCGSPVTTSGSCPECREHREPIEDRRKRERRSAI